MIITLKFTIFAPSGRKVRRIAGNRKNKNIKEIEMKTIRIFAASLAVLSAVSCGANGKKDIDGVKAPSKGLVDSVSYYLGVNYGQMLKQYDFGDVDYDLMVKGMKDFVAADLSKEDIASQFKYNPEEMNETINSYLAIRSEYMAAVRSAEQKAFFESNAAKEGVQTTESGLQYKILEPGSEKKATAVDTVSVHYKGTLIDGTVFDQTPEDGDPVELTLDRVIAGWTEGLQLIGEGGKIILYVPSELGYGDRGAGMIPGGSTLIFEVTLDAVKARVE